VPVLNLLGTTLWKRIGGSGCTNPRILDLGTSWRWVFSFTPRPLYPRENSPRWLLDMRLGGPQNRSGRREKEENLSLPGTRNSDLLTKLHVRIADWGENTTFGCLVCRRCFVSENSPGVIAHPCGRIERNMKLSQDEWLLRSMSWQIHAPVRNYLQYPTYASHSPVILLPNTRIRGITEDLLTCESCLGRELSEIRYVNSNISECRKVISLISIN
jgi:hypothetical protein